MFNSNIDYEEFENSSENELFMSVNEEPTNNSNSYDNSTSYNHSNNNVGYDTNTYQSDIWMPSINLKDSVDFAQPRPLNNYTNLVQETKNELEDTREMLRMNMGNLVERNSRLKHIDSLSEDLLESSKNFKEKSKKLKYKMISQYVCHFTLLLILILFIITLIVILVKG